MSEALYVEFLQPLLLVGLFERPEHLSAATMIETLYFYSAPQGVKGLQHAPDADHGPSLSYTVARDLAHQQTTHACLLGRLWLPRETCSTSMSGGKAARPPPARDGVRARSAGAPEHHCHRVVQGQRQRAAVCAGAPLPAELGRPRSAAPPATRRASAAAVLCVSVEDRRQQIKRSCVRDGAHALCQSFCMRGGLQRKRLVTRRSKYMYMYRNSTAEHSLP